MLTAKGGEVLKAIVMVLTFSVESDIYMFDERSSSGIRLQRMISLFTKLSPNPFPANMST